MSDPRHEYTPPYDPARSGQVFGHDPTAPDYEQQYQQYPQYQYQYQQDPQYQYQYQYQQYPPQYTTPYPGYPGAMGPPPRNGAGMTALILGICTFAVSCLPLAFGAIIAGHIGMNRAKRGEADNYMHAKAGVIMGYIGLGLMLAIVAFYVFLVVLALNDPSSLD